MSSREIAELFGKRHDNVLQKIRSLESAYTQVFGGQLKFQESYYLNSQNKKQPEILLNKSQALFVAARFDAVLHAKVQKRWEELESGQAEPKVKAQPILPAQIAEHTLGAVLRMGAMLGLPAHLSTQYAGSIAARQSGIPEIADMASKSPVMDNIPDAEVYLEPTELGAYFGLSAIAMNRKLAAMGLQTRQGNEWVPTATGKRISVRHAWAKKGKCGYNLKWNREAVAHLLETTTR